MPHFVFIYDKSPVLLQSNMYNFLKVIFGIPSDDNQRPRGNYGLSPGAGEDEWPRRNDTGEENILRPFEPSINAFNFPLFNGAMDIHKCIENFLGEMERSMDLFGFGNQHSLIWDEHNNGGSLVSNSHESIQHAGSLRDSFLKSPNQSHHISKADIDLDGKIDIADVENLLNNKSEATAYDKVQTANYTPSVYSKSVYIRTVRHPDGSVETIRKVRDHTGNEETTITHDNLPTSPHHPDLPGDDASGISIFRKFFSF